MSQRPGTMYLPETSMRWASEGILIWLLGPTAMIFPALETTVAFGIGGSPVTSTTVPPMKANVPVCRPGNEDRERGLVLIAHGLEVIELSVGGDQRGQVIGAVHP